MSKYILSILAAGAMSGGIFLLVASLGLGFYFMFIATLPLLTLGLGHDPKMALGSGAVASLIIAVIAGSPVLGVMFLLFLGLPSWAIASQALTCRPGQGSTATWFPIGTIMLRLTIYGVSAVALLTAYYALSDETIVAMMSRVIHEAFADLQKDFGDVIETLATQWSFLIFSMTIWLWGVALYAHGWLANRLLKNNNRQIRPDFAVTPFTIPNWMLTLLAICALASLIGGESMRFLGKTTLISLMLPYFFLGASLMHETSKTWPSRRFFLFFIYLSMFVQFWPALILSGVGLWHQIKHLSAPTPSSRN